MPYTCFSRRRVLRRRARLSGFGFWIWKSKKYKYKEKSGQTVKKAVDENDSTVEQVNEIAHIHGYDGLGQKEARTEESAVEADTSFGAYCALAAVDGIFVEIRDHFVRQCGQRGHKKPETCAERHDGIDVAEKKDANAR